MKRRSKKRKTPRAQKTSPVVTNGSKEPAIILGAILASVLVHGFTAAKVFGEADAARLAVYALEWHYTGSFASYTYALRTSPLYISWIKSLVEIGILPQQIPMALSWTNVIVGSLTIAPLYYLWRNLFGARTATIACVLYFFTPVYWLANIYGMAHLPAFSFFVASLLLYERAVRGAKNRWGWLAAGSAVLGAISVMLKADIILCFGAYLGVGYYTRRLKWKNLAAACVIPLVSVASVLMYTHWITSGIPPVESSAVQWSEKYPFTIAALRDADNRMVMVNTVGWVLSLAIVAGLVYSIVRRRHGHALVLIGSWALPPVLFWGLKLGNSARHMMAPFSALLVIAALALVSVVQRRRWLAVAVVCLLAANYVIGNRDTGGTTSPPSQLHRLPAMVDAYGEWRHNIARTFVEFPYGKKVYAGGAGLPYVAWECLAYARKPYIEYGDPVTYGYEDPAGLQAYLTLRPVKAPCGVKVAGDWLLYSFEDSVVCHNTPLVADAVARFKQVLIDKKLVILEPRSQ